MSDFSPNAILFDKLGNPISVINDGTNYRLCVDTRPAAGVSAQQQAWGASSAALTLSTVLTRSGSSALNIAAAGASPFTVTAGAKLQTFYALRLVFSFTTVTFNGTNFGAAPIANGVSIQVTSGGTTATVYTIKTNEDFYLANGGGLLTSAGTGVLVTSTILFNQPLVANSTDQIAVVINDNLSIANILYGRAIAFGVRAP